MVDCLGWADAAMGFVLAPKRIFRNLREECVEKTVLIVEDNELNMRLFSDLVQAEGHKTLQVRRGDEALDIIPAHRPDLVIMDVQIPGISGLEVTSRIKKDSNLASIPVLVVSAFAMVGDKEKIEESGCDGYITKPVDVTAFMKAVRIFLSKEE